MKAIVVHQHGGPEVMQYGDAPQPAPGPGQVLVRIAYSGINYIDTYFRTGLYKADLPLIPGQEASGTIEQIGEGMTGFSPGDRVAYTGTRGSYAEYAVIPAAQLVAVPSGVPMDLAAALLLQGMTAHYLCHSTFPLQAGQTCLIHAAAGGVGQILVQLAKQIGARVIATVGSQRKAELARQAGADDVILYTEQNFETETKRLTNNEGVHVVYDSVGASTFEQSLRSLRPRGMMVTFGNASGPVPPLSPLLLTQHGSLFLTRPSLVNYIATRPELLERANALFSAVQSGALKLQLDHTYPLADAVKAHQDLEGRRTTGKLLLQVAG